MKIPRKIQHLACVPARHAPASALVREAHQKFGAALTVREAATLLRDVAAKREARASRRPSTAAPQTATDRLRAVRARRLAAAYSVACPDYAGGSSVRVEIHATHCGVDLSTASVWRDYGSRSRRVAAATLTVRASPRLARAVRRGWLPAVVDGVAHVDATRTPGGWRVLCAAPKKGARTQPAPVWQYLATVDGHAAHGATLAEARATAAAWCEREARDLAAKARDAAHYAAHYRREKLIARLLARGCAPACWARLTVDRADCVTAGACRVGTDAWLGRVGLALDAAALPLALILRAASRAASDQSHHVAAILAAALSRQVPAYRA